MLKTMLNKKIILGVTGGIAAYKAAELIRLLRKNGADVQVVMTESATKFISPLTLQALSGKPVLENMWEPSKGNGMEHINQSRDSDLIVIAPASANFIAKISQGIADDLLTNICLARSCPLMIAPSMNKKMWENPATRRNISLIIKDGITISGPDNGEQACGEEGMGRLVSQSILLLDIKKNLSPQLFENKNILISCGGTVEKIDDARAITNLSSGKMGFSIAESAYAYGASVTLVCGRTDEKPPSGITSVYAPSHKTMKQVILEKAKKNDIFISVAAISDYLPKKIAGKMKKTNTRVTLELEKSDDILSEVSLNYKNLFCVGFSAESEKIIKNSQTKLKNKKLDMIVANSIKESMGKESTEIYIIDHEGVTNIAKKNKKELSQDILKHLCELVKTKGAIHDFIN